jgi:hypothetical protein
MIRTHLLQLQYRWFSARRDPIADCAESAATAASDNEQNSRLQPRHFNFLSELAIAVLLLLPLFQILWTTWSTGRTFVPYSIGGYLPWSDASGWFSGGIRLLLHGKLNGYSATRVVNESFVAALLFFSNQNLQLALIVRTAFIALAFFLFVREVLYRLGVACAAITAIGMVGFVAGFGPTMMSEPTAVLFGTLGATLLLLAADDRKPQLFPYGLFLMTLALAARPGPFLVLPVLAVWAGRCFAEEKHFAIRPMMWAACGVASGLAITAVLHHLYTVSGTVPFENFGYPLYGLAKGGQDWTVVISDYGYLPSANIALDRALTMIRANPALFLAGMWKFVVRFLKDQFIYIDLYPWACCSVYQYEQWYRAPFVVFEIIGLICALRPGRARLEELCALTFVGCVMSSAFTFSEAFFTRIFASTNNLQALLAGLGAGALAKSIRARTPTSRYHTSSATAAVSLAFVLTLSLILTPPVAALVRSYYPARPSLVSWCHNQATPILLDLGRSSPFLRIAPPGTHTFVPRVAEDKFLQLVHHSTFHSLDVGKQLATIRQGDLLVLVYDLSGFHIAGGPDGMPVWLVVHGAMNLAAPARYRVCATEESVPTNWGMAGYFTAQKVERVKQ